MLYLIHFHRRSGILKLVLILSIILSGQILLAQIEYFPDRGSNWESHSPKSQGINESKLDDAISFALENEYSGSRDLRIAILEGFAHEPYHEIAGPTKKRGGPAGIILKDGFIISQWGDVNRVDMTFSVTKSYLSSMAALAIDNGIIEDISDPVVNYIWDGTFDGKHNEKITWEHLLNQSSDWSGNLFGMYDWADRPPIEGGIDDWKNRKLNEPGTHYKYNDVRVNALAYALLQIHRKPLPAVLKEEIMDPIGASSTWRWYGYGSSWVNVDGTKVQSVSGGGHSGGGLFINTLDHARYGLLFLNNGNWNGKQIISKDWIDKAVKPSSSNPSYGYLWWLNKGERKMEGIADNVFYAAGFGGNYIVIIPDENMVVVTRWLEPSKLGQFLELVLTSIQSK